MYDLEESKTRSLKLNLSIKQSACVLGCSFLGKHVQVSVSTPWHFIGMDSALVIIKIRSTMANVKRRAF